MRSVGLLAALFAGGLMSAGSAVAQEGSEGSVYSRYGLGQLQPFYASKAGALGGEALGYSSGTFLNLANPASLSDQVLTRLSGGGYLHAVEATDAFEGTSTLSSSRFAGASIGIPLIARKVGLGFGFTPVSVVGYRIEATRALNLGSELDGPDTFDTEYRGTGGLNRISFGLGYRASPLLAVGIRTDMVFGIIDDIQQTIIPDTRFANSRVVRSTRLRGFSAGVGARLSLTSVLRDNDFLNFGLAVDLPNQLTATRTRTEGFGATTDTLAASQDGTVDLPVSIAFGFLYQPSPKVSWNADVRYEPWSSFESSVTLPGYAPNGASQFDDRLRMSTGIEYFPAGRDLLASYLQRTAYRFGVFRESGYISPDATERINTFGLTGGLSLPTLGGGTRIDINLDAGTRGTATSNLVRDRFLRIGVHLNFAERWFVRRQLG